MLTRAEIPGLIATIVLVVTGVVLAGWHWRSWSLVAGDPTQATAARWAQCRRRMQVAGLIGLEGILLCFDDTILPILMRAGRISEFQMATTWTIIVLVMLLVAVWIALLAFGDLAVTMSQSRDELRQVRKQEQDLHDEIRRYRQQNSRTDGL